MSKVQIKSKISGAHRSNYRVLRKPHELSEAYVEPLHGIQMRKRMKQTIKSEVSQTVLEDTEDISLRTFRRSILVTEFQIMNSLECQDK